MQERSAPNSVSEEPVPGRPDWVRLAVLLVLSTALHAWLISHTVVISRDTIGFVRYARMLERRPWTEALPNLEQHPLYPAAVLAASLPLRHFLGDNVPAFVLASQLVSALGGILLIIPMYYLGRELFDRRVAFWGTALFQCLPACAQITSDGLSDGLFLLLLATALLLAVRALRRGSVAQLALCGLASGLAYLGRPEGLIVVGVALLVLGGMQLVRRERWPWRRALAGSLGLLAGAAVVAGPYMATIGGLTVKPSARHLFHNDKPQDTLFQPATSQTGGRPPSDTAALSRGAPLCAATFAIWWMDAQRTGEPPWTWGVNAIVVEFAHGFHYFAFIPAVLGLCWFGGRVRSDPGARVVLLWCLVLGLLLFRVALGVHYLSERHMLALVMCGSLWAAAAALRIADALPGLIGRVLRRPLSDRTAALLQLAWLLLLVGWCAPASLRPLHINRAGHRAAGEWLAAHVTSADRITDPHCWALFYSGLVFEKHPPGAADTQPIEYVVVTRSKNPHARLAGVQDAEERSRQGKPVFSWTPTRQERKSYGAEEVLVYAVPAGRPQ
jgi:hypothetical protein